jgi:hypothetical protein
LLTIDIRRPVGAAKQLPPRDRHCRVYTFCGASGEAGVESHEVRVKAHGRGWSVAGLWLVRIGAAEKHGANGRLLETFNGDDVIRADVERGKQDERRHARRRLRGREPN